MIEIKVAEIGKMVEKMGYKPATGKYDIVLRQLLAAHATGKLSKDNKDIKFKEVKNMTDIKINKTVLEPNLAIKGPEDIRDLLVIVAMDVEKEAILKGHNYSTIEVNDKLGIEVNIAKVGKTNLYIAKSGVGLVNAAMTVALIADKYPINAILFTGVGGALQTNLDIGDVVISKNVLQHDSIYSGEKGKELMASGELYLSLPKSERVDPLLSSHPILLEWLSSILTKDSSQHVHVGTILSGSEFVGSANRKSVISTLHKDALLVDMESAGIAQVANKLGIPFVVVKTVADRLNPDHSISTDYNRFVSSASHNAGKLFDNVCNEFKKE